ncbi:MAG: TonB-dependent receptor [Prevotella sp.]|nr:TonB-dependent receptor [Prevotella sp.]
MMRTFSKYLIALLLTLCPGLMLAQSFTLSGRVTDEGQAPIEFCTVSCAEQGRMTMTNLQGEFSLSLESADSVVVRFSMLGYRAKTRVLRRPRSNQKLLITLSEDNTLDEVTVKEMKRQTGQMEELSTEQLKRAPSVSGNAVEELIQSQAGVSTHSELSSQYNVRGGSFDENSVYINGVEIYRPFLVRSGQQEGLSAINPDMVDRIAFSTGGYEARYGDKMSSALDITYRKPTKTEASAQVSLLGASAYVGIGNKRFSWSNGFRYKTNSYLLGTLETKGEYRPSQIDYQTYLSYSPSDRWTIDIIGNINTNHYTFAPSDRETAFGTMEDVKNFKVYFDGEEHDLFRTYFGSIAVTRHITQGTSLSLLGSAFKTSERESYDLQGQYWLTETATSENLGVGTYFQHARNRLNANVESVKLLLKHKTRAHNAEFGLTFKHEHIVENSNEYEMRDSAGYSMPHTGSDLYMVYSMRADNKLTANRVEAYLQDTWRFGKEDGTRFTLNYGLRLSHWSFTKETIVSPRVSLAIIPIGNQNITWRIAGGLYYQAPFFKELRDTTTVNGITYASLNTKAKSQRSIHIIGAFDYRFNMANRPFKFTAEAYYKILGNLVPYSINNVQVIYYGDNLCNGHAAGIDLKLFGEFVEGTDSWVSFSWMNTAMKLGGVSLPLPTDQRYAVNLFFTDYFPGTDRWTMSLKLAFADGLPFSTPHRELQTNSYRAPAYKRVDIGMSYRLINNTGKPRKTVRNVWLGVDCLNLLGINNVNSYYWVTDVTNNQYAVPNYLTGRQINGKITVEL